MSIEEQFNLIAKEYDSGRRQFIPCFDDYYEKTTDFISANITPPRRVLDLGAGTGLLTMYWYRNFPNASYVLVDIAQDMLKGAKERFCGLENMQYQDIDYAKEFPFFDFDAVVSALSIHHLEHNKKRELFCNIYNHLPAGGLFVNYDQFCAGSKEFDDWFDSFWVRGLKDSGLSDKDIEMWESRRKLDRECSVEEEISMLKDAGFDKVKCVYSYQKFSVIVAVK